MSDTQHTEHPRATDEQLAVLQSVGVEAGIDISRMAADLTRRECDALIKGCVVMTEIWRMTGERHLPLREVREAIRYHLSEV